MAFVSRFSIFVIFLGALSGSFAIADEYSPNSGSSYKTPEQAEAAIRANALAQTQNAVLNPQQRAKLTNQTPQAQAADQSVQNLAGSSGSTDDVYKLAMDVFNNIYKDCNGDPVKMKAEMEKFKRDPAGFAGTWTPAQQAKLKEIADKLNATSLPSK